MLDKEELNEEQIETLRYYLRNRLDGYKGNKKIKIDIDPKILEKLIFTYEKCEITGELYKTFELYITSVKKLDLSDISFDDFNAYEFDFSGLYGVKLNPQKVFNKDLRYAKLKGVEITGPFDDCEIYHTNFTGSIGATMSYNQYVKYGRSSNLTDVEIKDHNLGEYFEKINEAFRFKKRKKEKKK